MYVYMTETIDRLLTVEDVMATLRISRPTLYRLLKAGHLIPVRIGKRTLFDPTDIRAFVDASKQAGPPAAEKKSPAKTLRAKRAQPQKRAKPEDTGIRDITEGTPDEVLKKSGDTKQPKAKPSDEEDKQGRLL
jgi:excisionase family DNA binding protein